MDLDVNKAVGAAQDALGKVAADESGYRDSREESKRRPSRC